MSENDIFKAKQETDLFSKINQRYLPFWPLFVVTTSICLIVSIVYLRSEVPMFVAQSKVLLKDPNKGSESKVLEALNIFADKKIVDNEIIVLKSTSLMTEVVKKLDLYATVYNKGKVRSEELFGLNAPVQFQALDKDIIYPSGPIYFKMDWKNSRVLFNNNSQVNFDSTIKLNNQLFRVKVNPIYNRNLVGKNYYVQFNNSESIGGSLASTLDIRPASGASTVLLASMQTTEPEKGKQVLNILFNIYNVHTIEEKNVTALKTLSFVDDRLRFVTKQLDSVQNKISAYKSNLHVYDLSNQAHTYLEKVTEIDKKNTDIDLQLEILNDINNYIRNKGPKHGTVPALSLISDPILSNLVSRLYDAEIQLEKTRTLVGDQNDNVIMQQDQISKLKRDIFENLSNIRNNLTSAKNFNENLVRQNNELLNEIPSKEQGLLEISRNESIKNALYTYLLQKREETAISSASTTADLKVIEAATAYGPIKPIAKNYYLTGLSIGILLSIFLILIKEQLNRKVLFRSELEEKTKVPVVGELVQVSSDEPIVVMDGKRSVIAEQFRSIRTNLGFLGVNDTNNKTILITSSISGEGKSFVAVNLAISFSLMDKKVALLEMDLRKPRLSKLMKVSRDPGISNFLVGKATIEEIIKPTHINNLFIVSSGAIPPNPAELLLRPEFNIMMTELKSRFDYVIIDTAPIGPVSDAQLITSSADTTLFVIRHDFTPKIFLQMIKSVYDGKKYKNMSIIFNGLKRRGISLYNSDYGGYDYGYGYGYGYGGGYSYGEAYYEKSKKLSFFEKIKKSFS